MKRLYSYIKRPSASHHSAYELEVLQERFDKNILIIAFVATLILHALLVVVPLVSLSFLKLNHREKPQETQLEVDWNSYKFVETNPALENQTTQEKYTISNRSQHAAQSQPDPNEHSLVPLNEKGEEAAHKVVDGSFVRQNQDPQLAQDPARDAVQSVREPSRQVREKSYPEFLEKPVSSDMFSEDGTRIPRQKRDATKKATPSPKEAQDTPFPDDNPMTEHNESQVAVAVTEESVDTISQTGVRPRPRKRIQLSPVPGPLKASRKSASELGVVSVEAAFSEFGDYLQRMIEAISTQWSLLAIQSQLGVRDWGSHVNVTFKIHRDGSVTDVTLDANTSSELGSVLCRDAVLSRAPFGEWTQEMVQLLGEEQVIHMGFTYR